MEPVINDVGVIKRRAVDQEMWQAGVDLFDEGRYAEAIDYLRVSGTCAPLSYSLGLCYGKLGEWGEALKSFDAALSLDPYMLIAFYGRGVAHHHTGDYMSAIRDFDRALERFNLNRSLNYRPFGLRWTITKSDVHFSLALSFDALGDIGSAHRQLRLARADAHPIRAELCDLLLSRLSGALHSLKNMGHSRRRELPAEKDALGLLRSASQSTGFADALFDDSLVSSLRSPERCDNSVGNMNNPRSAYKKGQFSSSLFAARARYWNEEFIKIREERIHRIVGFEKSLKLANGYRVIGDAYSARPGQYRLERPSPRAPSPYYGTSQKVAYSARFHPSSTAPLAPHLAPLIEIPKLFTSFPAGRIVAAQVLEEMGRKPVGDPRTSASARETIQTPTQRARRSSKGIFKRSNSERHFRSKRKEMRDRSASDGEPIPNLLERNGIQTDVTTTKGARDDTSATPGREDRELHGGRVGFRRVNSSPSVSTGLSSKKKLSGTIARVADRMMMRRPSLLPPSTSTPLDRGDRTPRKREKEMMGFEGISSAAAVGSAAIQPSLTSSSPEVVVVPASGPLTSTLTVQPTVAPPSTAWSSAPVTPVFQATAIADPSPGAAVPNAGWSRPSEQSLGDSNDEWTGTQAQVVDDEYLVNSDNNRDEDRFSVSGAGGKRTAGPSGSAPQSAEHTLLQQESFFSFLPTRVHLKAARELAAPSAVLLERGTVADEKREPVVSIPFCEHSAALAKRLAPFSSISSTQPGTEKEKEVVQEVRTELSVVLERLDEPSARSSSASGTSKSPPTPTTRARSPKSPGDPRTSTFAAVVVTAVDQRDDQGDGGDEDIDSHVPATPSSASQPVDRRPGFAFPSLLSMNTPLREELVVAMAPGPPPVLARASRQDERLSTTAGRDGDEDGATLTAMGLPALGATSSKKKSARAVERPEGKGEGEGDSIPVLLNHEVDAAEVVASGSAGEGMGTARVFRALKKKRRKGKKRSVALTTDSGTSASVSSSVQTKAGVPPLAATRTPLLSSFGSPGGAQRLHSGDRVPVREQNSFGGGAGADEESVAEPSDVRQVSADSSGPSAPGMTHVLLQRTPHHRQAAHRLRVMKGSDGTMTITTAMTDGEERGSVTSQLSRKTRRLRIVRDAAQSAAAAPVTSALQEQREGVDVERDRAGESGPSEDSYGDEYGGSVDDEDYESSVEDATENVACPVVDRISSFSAPPLAMDAIFERAASPTPQTQTAPASSSVRPSPPSQIRESLQDKSHSLYSMSSSLDDRRSIQSFRSSAMISTSSHGADSPHSSRSMSRLFLSVATIDPPSVRPASKGMPDQQHELESWSSEREISEGQLAGILDQLGIRGDDEIEELEFEQPRTTAFSRPRMERESSVFSSSVFGTDDDVLPIHHYRESWDREIGDGGDNEEAEDWIEDEDDDQLYSRARASASRHVQTIPEVPIPDLENPSSTLPWWPQHDVWTSPSVEPMVFVQGSDDRSHPEDFSDDNFISSRENSGEEEEVEERVKRSPSVGQISGMGGSGSTALNEIPFGNAQKRYRLKIIRRPV